MASPRNYVAYRFEEKNGDLKRVVVPWKDPKHGEVVVKVLACGICGTDHHVQSQQLPSGLPRIPGHEIIGDIVALGPGEQYLKVGDRVGSGWHGGHCGRCRNCGVGKFNLCEHADVNGVFRDGGYAEYVTLRVEAVNQVPKDLDPAEAAPLFCGGVTMFNAIRNTNAVPGDVVAIQGIGGLGHLGIQFAAKMGYRVVALSTSGSKRDIALRLGAHDYIDGSKVNTVEALNALGGARVILATAPSNKAIANLLPALAADGQLVVAGISGDTGEVSLSNLIINRASILSVAAGTPADVDAVINFSRLNGVKCMIERIPLKEAQKALDTMSSVQFRSVLVPELGAPN